jgi:hypothetical protein
MQGIAAAAGRAGKRLAESGIVREARTRMRADGLLRVCKRRNARRKMRNAGNRRAGHPALPRR